MGREVLCFYICLFFGRFFNFLLSLVRFAEMRIGLVGRYYLYSFVSGFRRVDACVLVSCRVGRFD